MNITWRQSAVNSLIKLDEWREQNEWPPIGSYLVETVEAYFQKQDMTVYVPGRVVSIKGMACEHENDASFDRATASV